MTEEVSIFTQCSTAFDSVTQIDGLLQCLADAQEAVSCLQKYI